MKKLIVTSALALSFLTAGASQLLESDIVNDSITKTEPKNTTTVLFPEVVEEDLDEAFEFDTKKYLPVGFNASLSLNKDFDLDFSLVGEEEDEDFDFDTNAYLPVGFNLNADLLKSIVEIEIVEEDEPFGFDTKSYLPKGFNPLNKEVVTNEL